jgi:esterase
MSGRMIPYDEFSLFHENADEFGIPYAGPPDVRRVSADLGDGRRLSALLWGRTSPELVFLHGGAQNAHTWDTVALALGRPLVAIDLPGHGHSDGGRNGSLDLAANAVDVATAIRVLAPAAQAVIGMSLGGLTAINLAATAPDLVRKLVLIDVTPSAYQRFTQMTDTQRGTIALAQGERSYPDFASMLEATIATAPHRDRDSLRRGVFHNSKRLPDGSWTWRYDSVRKLTDFIVLWDDVSKLTMPVTLVRGGASMFVTADDIAEFTRRCPRLQVHTVPGSGHSVQSDAPRQLVDILRDVLAGPTG